MPLSLSYLDSLGYAAPPEEGTHFQKPPFHIELPPRLTTHSRRHTRKLLDWKCVIEFCPRVFSPNPFVLKNERSWRQVGSQVEATCVPQSLLKEDHLTHTSL